MPDALRNQPDASPMSDWLLLLVPGTIWGASFLFIAEGLEATGPMGVTLVRIPDRAGEKVQTVADLSGDLGRRKVFQPGSCQQDA